MFGFFYIGRLPNTKRLNLEAVGVELDEMGAVKEDEFSSTNIPSIWVVGDVTNRLNLTPVALMEGTCFSKTVFGGQPTKPDYSNVPCAVFCIPPLCVVGLSEEEAIEQAKGDVSIFTSTFNPMKNTVSGRQEKTVMKLVVDSEIDKVIGASMCGPDAPEIMQVAGKPGPTVKRISGLSILDNNGVNLVSILLTTVLDMLQMKKNAKAIAKHASNKNGPKTENDRPSSAIIYGSGMNIVFVGAEVGPWSKTGGLGDVLGGLPPAMAGNGHRVMTVSPRYDQYKDAWDTHVLQIKIGDRIETVRFFHCYKRGVDRVFVDHPMFLEKIISP